MCVYLYIEAMLLPVLTSHMGALCIVGVGVAKHSHLLQDTVAAMFDLQ